MKMKETKKMIIWIILMVIMIVAVGFLITNIVMAKTYSAKNPVATFEIENYGTIKIELYPEYAPNTVANFINLINKGFYDGKVFYGKDVNAIYAVEDSEGETVEPTMSLVDDSIEEGSDEDVEYQIAGEFVANGYDDNTLKHEEGVISMVRSEYSSYLGLTEQGYNSASCHFQILLDTSRSMNGLYTAFGKVTEGLDVVQAIFDSEAATSDEEETEETSSDENEIVDLATPAVITSATVETYGVDYGVPEVSEAFDYSAYLTDYFSTYFTTSE